MKTRFTLVVLLALAGAALFVARRAAGTGNENGSAKSDVTPRSRNARPPRVAVEQPATVAVLEAKPSFAAAREYVRVLYRKEQLTRELALEQQRYGAHYWQPECDGRERARLQREREALVRELNDEANAVLRALFPGESGAPFELNAIFDAERAGPKVSFLSADACERFEAALLRASGEPDFDAAGLLGVAERALAPDELAEFRRWNDPAAAALRERLVGFEATEGEFVALLRAASLASDASEGNAANAIALELDATRAARLRQLDEPALRTALRDLRRLGLKLTEADWLAATRAQAVVSIQRVWEDPVLSSGAKQGQVTLLEQTFSRTITERLGLPGSTIDELPLGP